MVAGLQIEPRQKVLEGGHVDHAVLAQVLAEDALAKTGMGGTLVGGFPESLVVIPKPVGALLVVRLGQGTPRLGQTIS